MSSAEPRSFGHSHRSFGRSFGRIFAQKLGEIFGKMQQKIVGLSRTSLFCYNQKILIEKKTQFQLVIRCHNITLMWYSNNEFVKFEKLREIRPKWRNFIDSVVRYAWPKLRPNYFGRNWPKLRPKLRFRSYTTDRVITFDDVQYHHRETNYEKLLESWYFHMFADLVENCAKICVGILLILRKWSFSDLHSYDFIQLGS